MHSVTFAGYTNRNKTIKSCIDNSYLSSLFLTINEQIQKNVQEQSLVVRDLNTLRQIN